MTKTLVYDGFGLRRLYQKLTAMITTMPPKTTITDLTSPVSGKKGNEVVSDLPGLLVG